MGLYAVSGSNPMFATKAASTTPKTPLFKPRTAVASKPASTSMFRASDVVPGTKPGTWGGVQPTNPTASPTPTTPNVIPNPATSGTYTGPTLGTGSGLGSQVGQQRQTVQTQGFINNSVYPTMAHDLAQRQMAPQIISNYANTGYNNLDYMSKAQGFTDARTAALNDYNNSMALLANSRAGNADKAELLRQQQALAQRYYDRLATGFDAQMGAAARQVPLIDAQRADNNALFTITTGQAGRSTDRVNSSIAEANQQNEVDKFTLEGQAATGGGWENKGARLAQRAQQNTYGRKLDNYQRDIADIASNLEKERIGKDANDRNLTESEAKIMDQLGQLGRDKAGGEDKRQGDYLQYLYDIKNLGRQQAEIKLREKQASDARQAQYNQIAQQQVQAQTARNRSNTDLALGTQKAIVDQSSMPTLTAAFNQIMSNPSIVQQYQTPDALKYLSWLTEKLRSSGATDEAVAHYIATFMSNGGVASSANIPK